MRDELACVLGRDLRQCLTGHTLQFLYDAKELFLLFSKFDVALIGRDAILSDHVLNDEHAHQDSCPGQVKQSVGYLSDGQVEILLLERAIDYEQFGKHSDPYVCQVE